MSTKAQNDRATETLAAFYATNPGEAFTMPRAVYLSGAKFAGMTCAYRAEFTQGRFTELVASGAVVFSGRYSGGYRTYKARG